MSTPTKVVSTTDACTATCSRFGCAQEADWQPWVFGMGICWLCRLMAAGRLGGAS